MPGLDAFPTQEGLNALYGSYNPMSYFRGYANQNLADQFRQQSMLQEQNTTKQGQQKIQHDEIFNPLLQQEKLLQNTGRGYENTTKQLQVERDQANQQNLLNEQQRKAAISMTDDEFKQMDQHIEAELRSGDPARVKQALKLQSLTPTILAEKRKHSYEMEKLQEQTRSHLAGIGMNNKSAKEIEQLRINAGKYERKSFAMTISDRIMRAKTPIEKAEALEDAYATASLSGDTEAAAEYQRRAQEARLRAAEDARNRGAANPRADLNALGVETTAPPSANAPIGGSGPRPGTAQNPIVLK